MRVRKIAIHIMVNMATRIRICTKTSDIKNSIVSNTTRTNISSRKQTTNIFDCIKIWTMIVTTITRAIDRTTLTARRITLTLNTLRGLDRVFPLMGFHFVLGDKALG